MNIAELCVNCKQNNSCTMCWKTSNKKCPHFIQKSNAYRIRAMSDEELATDLLDMFEEICEDGVPSKEWMLYWLKQPAE